jgi:hypothetical protein
VDPDDHTAYVLGFIWLRNLQARRMSNTGVRPRYCLQRIPENTRGFTGSAFARYIHTSPLT